MKMIFMTIGRTVILLLLVLIIVTIAVIGFIHFSFANSHTEYFTIDELGTEWITDDGNVSFEVYQEMLVWTSETEEPSVVDGDLIGLGRLSLDDNESWVFCQLYYDTIIIRKPKYP